MTNSLTNSLLFRLDWRDPWVWRCQLARYCSGLHNLWQPCSRALRKWREKEKMKRKWRENEEMEWDSLSTFLNFLFISSLSIHFLYQTLSHFVTKCWIWHSQMSQKTLIPSRIHCEKSFAGCEGLSLLMLRHVLTTVWCMFVSWSFVKKLDFCSDSQHKVWSIFWRWSFSKIWKLKSIFCCWC